MTDPVVSRKIVALLDQGVRSGAFPGAVLMASRRGEVLLRAAAGFSALVPHPTPMRFDTLFDLASLTKPLATSLAFMKALERDIGQLDAPLAHLLDVPVPSDRAGVTLRMLLAHVSGLPDWRPFFRRLVSLPPAVRKAALCDLILAEPLAYPPGQGSLYSDLGFMLLETVFVTRTAEALPSFLDRSVWRPLGLEALYLQEGLRPRFAAERYAATERCPWRGRVLRGVTHDENAWALGGYGGQAGLFGTAEEVWRLAQVLLDHWRGRRADILRPEIVAEFLRRQELAAGSTWALGWDTPSAAASSAGRFFAPESAGHLGFTGTSLWIDPVREVIVVFLSNRVHPSRTREGIRAFRPRLHDAVMRAFGVG